MAAVDLVIVVLAGLIPIMAASLYFLADRTATVDAAQPTRKLIGTEVAGDRGTTPSAPAAGPGAVPGQSRAAAGAAENRSDTRKSNSDIHVMSVDPQAPTVRLERPQPQRA